MPTKTKIKKQIHDYIRRGALIELASRDFTTYCRLLYPAHYKPTRPHLLQICNEFQEFIESDNQVLILNAPPRHYKSFSSVALCQWVIGRWPAKKVMSGSYNEILSETFSKSVRNAIDTVKADPNIVTYSDIFPGIKIKRGDGAVNRWALEGQHATYLATSPTGTATGFGCDLMIIDDLIKSALEANNATVLEKHWQWLTDTMLSRLEEGGKIIIVMTRWHSQDLAGRALRHFTEIGWKVRHVSYQALQEDGSMLCPELLSHESYLAKTRTMGADIASANYQQIPIDIKGKLYTGFKTYDNLPVDSKGASLLTAVRAYIDTADEGSDFLCCIVYGVYAHEAYVIDVIYTQDAMEKTEPAVADMLTRHRADQAVIESNNGGRGFARNIERLLQVRRNFFTCIKWFHQSQNKTARILTNATWVMEHIYFPANWRDRWPAFYASLTTYQQNGKNAHDDAEDAITGIAERMNKKGPDIGAITVRS